MSSPDPSSNSVIASSVQSDKDPFVLYSQALHTYTLRLWTESRRLAEEKAREKQRRREEQARAQQGDGKPYNSQ
ncbi:hypothetical protein CONPUDRAFT_79138 [Coniophora puteana RWD-64-598 SS2]|uniref:Uncharacterized protein n=1 Tax=Coniophora puteana (strain RWD-64-598) TaxID=741705 RepID=A0A5M3N773_CONPW|nr:uncharacterized protein CONPUDRAFT_79138 [Coniophora puteana RWD-64-598 SS2]EIW86934.1 hypothetical protein CONPUDRAFT_79138 [Coniophora puteana RWD-64-598 SS2]